MGKGKVVTKRKKRRRVQEKEKMKMKMMKTKTTIKETVLTTMTEKRKDNQTMEKILYRVRLTK
jgi:hypothetical protein